MELIRNESLQIDVWGKGAAYPTCCTLSDGEIHVWSISLDDPAISRDELAAFLSPQEKERAARFRFERDRASWTVARGWLRLVLASYLGLEPQQVSFYFSHYGKPDLATGSEASNLRFNLSHSDRLALLALTRGRAIGVDVERIRHDFPCLEVAEHFFSLRERATLAALPSGQQHQAFFNGWTRKEAYIKARGEGLSLPLHQFDVSLAPDEPAQLLGTRPDPLEAARWSLRELDPGEAYAAALVVQGST